MKFPTINKQPMRSISIPELSGGMNLRESVSMVNDNQLTDCKNMWYRDGILKTRPAVKVNPAMCWTISTDYHGDTFESKPHNIYRNVDGKQYRLISYMAIGSNSTAIFFKYISADSVIELPGISLNTFAPHYFVVQYQKTLYCYTSGDLIQDTVYKLGETDTAWTALTEDDFYVPIVYAHCLCDENGDTFKSTSFEGHNLIGKRFRMIYSSVNKDLLDASVSTSSHAMQYVIPGLNTASLKVRIIHDFKVKITYQNGKTVTHSITKNEDPDFLEETLQSDGYRIGLGCIGNGNMLLSFFVSNGGVASVTASDHIEDNMEITVPCENTQDSRNKVFGMSRTEWFGSAAEGINGGARLFLGGNQYDKEKSLVIWSGLNNPLYFPENCYAYVGNSSSSVTAFGKQSDMLVIFKENETYFTRYTQNTDITAEDLINQNVVDYTSNRVYFPMIHLHATIGCDCPDTVQLCRNRLVWACKNGQVFTLITNDQYSERNIYDVSEMISKKLKAESGLSAAYSCDWDGRYLLLCKNQVYVLDYNSYGYANASSFSKTDDANARIPWHYWELSQPETALCSFTVGNVIGLFSMPDLYSSLHSAVDTVVSVIDGSGTRDQTVRVKDDLSGIEPVDCEIESLIQTKIFDFGAPSFNKNVPLVNIAFGSNNGREITVTFLTENGEEEQPISMQSEELQPDKPGYVRNVQFRPCARLINRFGIRIFCNGAMAIDAVSLNYRLLGGSR